MSALRDLIPRRIAVQITLVMLTALVAMSVIIFLLIEIARPEFPHLNESSESLFYGSVLAELNRLPADERQEFLQNRPVPIDVGRLRVMSASEGETALKAVPPGPGPQGRDGWRTRYQSNLLPVGVSLIREAPQPDDDTVGAILFFRLADGGVVEITRPEDQRPPFYFDPLFHLLLFLALSIALLLIWVATTLVKPLAELAKAASSFGQNSTTPNPIEETGPTEVREAARAFNSMQERIQDMIGKRTRMLAAIGHDLRTPLTRLRLRISLLEDGEQKERNLADLDMMEYQLNGALGYLRSGRSNEGSALIDLRSFLQGIVDQYEDMETAVPMICETGLKVNGRPTELNRAICNLIDNAIRYGERVEIHACTAGKQVLIDVVDHGQGIPAEDRERMMDPFERGDEARTYGKGVGFGLGLSIAQSISENHGGKLDLLDTEGGGLTASIRLPAA